MSAPPTPYTRNFDFNTFQTANPTLPLPGLQVDSELNEIKATTDQIISRLSEIQRDDGQVANVSIGLDQLKPEVTDLINTFGAGANTSAANAAASATDADASADAAAVSASEALAYRNEAQGFRNQSESARDLSATYRDQAQAAAATASGAISSAAAAAGSASAAAASATAASNSATAAGVSASDAATSANNAGSSANAALISADAASASAAAALAGETAADASADAAAVSAASASTSAGTATTKAGEAAVSAADADSRADAAFTYMNDAEASKNAAAASAASAATDAANADADAATASSASANATARWDDFRGRYFGALASAPTVDPVHGGAIDVGDFYYDTTAGAWQVRTGSGWAAMGAVTTGVSSFNGRTGAVSPANGDYNATMVSFTPSGSLGSTSVAGALAELDGDISALATIVSGKANTVHTHAISDVTNLQTMLDAKQPLDATLTALAGVVTSADKIIYATAADTFTTATLTTFGRSLIDDADAATARTTLGLGTAATQASTAFQTADATLTALAGLTTAADALPYFTAVDTAAVATFTAFARSLMDDADAAAARTTLGLGTAATQASTAFAAASHSHIIADVTGLQTALDGKAASSHTHTVSNISDFAEGVDDRVATLIVAGSGISVTYDDVANTLTVAATGGSSGMFTTGDVKDTFATSAPSGWVFADGRTIGNASSGATNRANADTADLFAVLWGGMDNTRAPVSGGRGASAAADFAANKTITLPDLRGRTRVGKDNMSGTAANRVTSAGSGIDGTILGNSGGAQNVTLTTTEMPAHTHNVPTYATGASGSTAGADKDNQGTLSQTATSSAGSSSAHYNMQPSLVTNVLIKL